MEKVLLTRNKLLAMQNDSNFSKHSTLMEIYISMCENMIESGKIESEIILNKMNSIIEEIENLQERD